MKKIKIKILLVIITIIGLTTAGIFYACENDQSNINQDKSLNLISNFITEKTDGTFIEVKVSRDQFDNAIIITNSTNQTSEKGKSLYISDEVKTKISDSENLDTLHIEILNNNTYWIVPLDGQTPVKVVLSDSITKRSTCGYDVYCTCYETTGSFNNRCCEKKWVIIDGCTQYKCFPKPSPCDCTLCWTNIIWKPKHTSTSFEGSIYFVQSNSITVNGVKYE